MSADRSTQPARTKTRERRSTWASRHELGLYFVLAYALSWSIWPLVALNPSSTPLVPFGPLLAAGVVSLAAGGWSRLRGLLGQLTRWRVHLAWYAVAVVGPFLVSLTAAALTVATGAPAPDPSRLPDPMTILVTLLTTILMVGLFEEVGWRGFALPRLQRLLPPVWAALTLGGIWALWHLPLLIDNDGQRPALPFLVGVLAQSVILARLYNTTSLPVVILGHAAVNTAARFTLPEFAGSDYLFAWWAQTALYVLIALLVSIRGGSGRQRPHTSRPSSTAAPTPGHRTTTSTPPTVPSRTGGSR